MHWTIIYESSTLNVFQAKVLRIMKEILNDDFENFLVGNQHFLIKISKIPIFFQSSSN